MYIVFVLNQDESCFHYPIEKMVLRRNVDVDSICETSRGLQQCSEMYKSMPQNDVQIQPAKRTRTISYGNAILLRVYSDAI